MGNYKENIFLSSEIEKEIKAENALFHVLPVPYEKTVSYGGGTANGPRKLIEASNQLEAFDGVSTPLDFGIFTHPEINCEGKDIEVLQRIKNEVKKVLGLKKIPVVIGGEHTVSYAPILALHENGKKFGVVQFDAHADLRQEYEGSIYSHACVMKRAVDLKIPLHQIAVRALSLPEVKTREEKKHLISFQDAREIAINGVPEKVLPENFPEEIYITIDVDGLDPSVILATGTPVPGGISWFQIIEFLEKIVKGRKVIGIDIVELAPKENETYSDFTAALLLYNLMGIITRNLKQLN